MAKGSNIEWRFRGNEELITISTYSVRRFASVLMDNLNKEDPRTVVNMGNGDPAHFACFKTTPDAVNGIVDAVSSAKFNCYTTAIGMLPARRAIADHLSKDLPYKLSSDDIFVTVGCTQAIEVILTVLARPGANILLPKPGYPYYEARAAFNHIEARRFNLLPDKGWEVDLKGVEELADQNTVAMVIINPGNPCGSVFSYQHLKQIAETARKLGIMVISDEVYGHLTFGNAPFIPMGVFGSIAPLVTVGSISKRWIVPGWRLGWLVTNDPNGFLKDSGVIESVKGLLNISPDPPTFIQGAVPHILEKTKIDFFTRIVEILRDDAEICFETIQEIPCMTCPKKPEGGMFVMVKLNVSMLDGITDDLDFCKKVALEESVIVLPGIALGMKNWLRVTFAIEPSLLREGLSRIKAFCKKHAKTSEFNSVLKANDALQRSNGSSNLNS